MYDVFVPFDNIDEYVCYSYDNTGNLIYAFRDFPTSENSTNVDIIYLRNHYNVVNSNIFVDNYNCIERANITNNWFYRNDLPDVLICFFFMLMFFLGIPFYLLMKVFKRKVL